MDNANERCPNVTIPSRAEALAERLSRQEKLRMFYWNEYDHFLELRMRWRASTMRHLFHILPGEKILEIGAGNGKFTRALIEATRRECEVTAVVFSGEYEDLLKKQLSDLPARVVSLKQFPGILEGERFDHVVAHHMLEENSRDEFLTIVKSFLKPGGQVLLFEPNPWNPYFRIRRFFRRLLPLQWKRPAEPVSLSRLQVFSVFSELGYTDIHAMPYDFLYAPIPKFLLWPGKNLSLIMENCPFVRNFAGSLFIWARNAGFEDSRKVIPDLCQHLGLKGKVSFVIPCHNEEMNVRPLVQKLLQYYEKYVFEIIIVDDNSCDNTFAVASQLSLNDKRIRVIKRVPPNGVGLALRDGLAAAQGEYIMTLDCDFQHIIPEMRDLFDAAAKGADVVVGSRFSRESVLLNYPFTKIIANRTFHVLANVLLGRHFRDISNNLKILKKDAARKISIEFADFAANAEIGLKALLLGFRVEEVPISWMNRSLTMGLSSFKIMRTGPNYGRLLFRLARQELAKKIQKKK